MSVLEAANISKSFRTSEGDILAVRNISFQVQKGEILAILGPNGAGKTTLISCLCSLLEPSRGTVFFNGRPISEISNLYRKRIGVVFEGNRNVYWYMSAVDNLRYFGRLLMLDERVIEEKTEELLKFFNLWEHRNKPVGTFSRGMQQKVAISVAFLNSAELLFLDEPSIGLDVIAKHQLVDQIRDISRKNGTTVILTSHQLDIVEKLADRILVIEKGAKIQLRPTDELKDVFLNQKLLIETRSILTAEQRSRIKRELGAKEAVFSEVDGWTRVNLIFKSSDRYATVMAIKCLLEMGISVHSIKQAQPTLEDVYVELFSRRS